MPPEKHQLLVEILEQPHRLEGLLKGFPENMQAVTMPGSFVQKLIGIGEGSSYNALKIAAPFIEEFTGLNNFTFEPESLENKFEVSQWVKQPIKRLFEHSYFLTVSQSGQTGSILRVVSQLQEAVGFSDRYSPMLALTNNPEGTLATRYGNHFYLEAGPEESIAATKSMTCSILALLLFGLHLGQQRAWLRRATYQQLLASLNRIPENLTAFLQNEPKHTEIQAFCERLCDTNQFIILSKGMLSTVLPEAGLKLTETSRNSVWTDNTESFKHGRKVILHGVKGVRPNCIYLIPPDMPHGKAEKLFEDMRAHFFQDDTQVFSTEGLFLIRFENSPPLPEPLARALNLAEGEILTLPESHGMEALFLAIVAFQLLSYYLALAKGEDPNNPALQKAVTR